MLNNDSPSYFRYNTVTSHHSTLGVTPAQLVFGRDMIFNMKALINWKSLSIKKQMSTDKSTLRENAKIIDYDYTVGQQVYVKRDKPYRKLEGPKMGPY